MNKKVRTYVLLGCVLCIWGILGFRIIETIRPTTTPRNSTVVTAKFAPVALADKDTFSIAADYRDPFLGTLPKKPAPKAHKQPKSVPQLPENHVRYDGFVTDTGTGNPIYFVRIGQRQHMMARGDEMDNVRLISGTSESLSISYEGRRYTISRQQ